MTQDLTPEHQFADAGPLANRMGIHILEASAQRVIGTMPVDGNTQPFGLLHGGASMVLAETLGSLGAHLHAGTGRTAVGIEINGSHHRGAKSGVITGVASAITLGKTLAVYEIVLTDEDGKTICTSRLTCLIRDLS